MSNVFKKVMLFGLMFTLVWSLNAVALADVSGDVGSTEASAEYKSIGEVTEINTGEAKANAISSPVGGTEGGVDAKLPPGEAKALSAALNPDGTTSQQVNNGSNGTTSVSDYKTTATANQPIEESSQVVATEEVDNVVINSPDNVTLRGQKLKVIVSATKSEGTSEIKECCGQNNIRSRSTHTMSQVSLFDGTILFSEGWATATTYYVKPLNTYDAVAAAQITGLRIWDPTPGNGYVDFGNFSNAVAAVQNHSATLASINTMLALSNIKITKFLEVSGSDNGGAGPASAEAKLLQAILYDQTNNPLVTVDLAHMKSDFNQKSASTSGKEISFVVKEETTITTTEEEEQPETIVQAADPVIESATETPVETSSTSPSAFPRTGLPNQSVELVLLMLASLMLLGSVLLRRKNKSII